METFEVLLRQPKILRAGVNDIPELESTGLRDCQRTAITNLEKSFSENRLKAVVQMATGSSKTFTSITSIFRLLKFAKAKRILFLVNTRNLGEQAEQEFKSFQPQDDNSLFPELYGVTRLSSSFIPHDSQVYISTNQRLYSILNGQPKNELIAEVLLLRTISGADTTLASFNKTVDKNFQQWIFKKQAGTSKYTTDQGCLG